MLVLFTLTIVSGVKLSSETNQINGKISSNHKEESEHRPIARKHFDDSDEVLPSHNYEEAYPDDGYKNGGKRTRKGLRRRKGDDYQDREWETVGKRERKKMGNRRETGEDYKEIGEKNKAGEDFVLMGKKARKGKDYVDWLDKCSLKGKGKKKQVKIPGCGGLILFG